MRRGDLDDLAAFATVARVRSFTRAAAELGLSPSALSHALNDKPSINALAPHILDPTDPIRIRLMGQLSEGVTSLLDRADTI